ncbi:hypothetical protein BHF70_07645 [Anaerostipes sp. 494a]|nr:hypothetical protein BHF70_07645 [Anaerostipes sp. 494a]
MSDYQRIVSYLYEYHHGIKGSNVGFAKIEKRQKQLKLYFHVKTNDKALEYNIYFYRFHQGTMEGILLDTIKRNDTIVEFKNTYPLVVDLDKIDGFLIYHSNEHFFGSEWKDRPIIIRNFLPLKQSSPEESVSTPEPEEIKTEKAVPAETTPVETNPPETNSATEEPKIKNPDTQKNKTIIPETKNPEIKQTVPNNATSKLVEYIEALQLEKEAKEQETSYENPDFDWKEYPTLPLPDIYCLSPSIKIQIEDLPKIPDLPKDIKTNGFLLLNYGNFGHLCLAWNSEHKRRYLGVPGIFDNEKSFISKLFGFQNFITVPPKKHKTGNFGYFILPV